MKADMKSAATVTTANASRYLQQLCKHWRHRFDVTFDTTKGVIALGDDRRLDMTADETALRLTLDAPADVIERMEQVVTEHIVRFAFREELIFSWRRGES